MRIREDFNADFVKSFAERGIDGVVYSLPAAKDGAAELARLALPTIALDIFDDAILCGRKQNSSTLQVHARMSDAKRQGTFFRKGSTVPMHSFQI